MPAAALLITVVLPTYQRGALLREAVRSVLAQTYPRWELIVVDDGSTDDSLDWLRSLRDPRVRALPLTRSGRPGLCRSAGVAAGTGVWWPSSTPTVYRLGSPGRARPAPAP